MERYLAEVSQSPSTAVLTEMQPMMTALTQREMLSHTATDVWVAVLVCICEVIRITAPNNPFSDDTTRFVFKRIMESFERIDDLKSRSYRKRVSILKSLVEVRWCIIMLDLGLDDLILEMFQCFLRRISLQHPRNVFYFMEKIMIAVISEELVSCLLWSVQRQRMVHLSVSFTLGETVIQRCASKLNPLLRTLVGDKADKYSTFVVSLCQETSDAIAQCDTNASAESESEGHIFERVVSDERPHETANAVEHDLEAGCPEETGSAGPSRGIKRPEEVFSGGLNREASTPPVVDINRVLIEEKLPSTEQKHKRPARTITKTPKAKKAEEMATLLVRSKKRKMKGAPTKQTEAPVSELVSQPEHHQSAGSELAVKGASGSLIEDSLAQAANVGHASGSKGNWSPEQILGKRIKVWWPIDKSYYDGTIEKYYHSEKKHLVSYDDGDFEFLYLKDEVWELLEEEEIKICN